MGRGSAPSHAEPPSRGSKVDLKLSPGACFHFFQGRCDHVRHFGCPTLKWEQAEVSRKRGCLPPEMGIDASLGVQGGFELGAVRLGPARWGSEAAAQAGPRAELHMQAELKSDGLDEDRVRGRRAEAPHGGPARFEELADLPPTCPAMQNSGDGSPGL